jgi:hypothetical protein
LRQGTARGGGAVQAAQIDHEFFVGGDRNIEQKVLRGEDSDD